MLPKKQALAKNLAFATHILFFLKAFDLLLLKWKTYVLKYDKKPWTIIFMFKAAKC